MRGFGMIAFVVEGAGDGHPEWKSVRRPEVRRRVAEELAGDPRGRSAVGPGNLLDREVVPVGAGTPGAGEDDAMATTVLRNRTARDQREAVPAAHDAARGRDGDGVRRVRGSIRIRPATADSVTSSLMTTATRARCQRYAASIATPGGRAPAEWHHGTPGQIDTRAGGGTSMSLDIYAVGAWFAFPISWRKP